MDLNKLTRKTTEEEKKTDDKEQSKGLNSPPPARYKVDIDEDESIELLDKFLMGEPIEAECSIKGKLTFTLRAPSSKMMTLQDRDIFSGEKKRYGSIAVAINNSLLGLYVAKFRDKDFVKEQGEKYSTLEATKERIDYILDHTIYEIKELILDEIEKFRAVLKKVFSDENLKNS